MMHWKKFLFATILVAATMAHFMGMGMGMELDANLITEEEEAHQDHLVEHQGERRTQFGRPGVVGGIANANANAARPDAETGETTTTTEEQDPDDADTTDGVAADADTDTDTSLGGGGSFGLGVGGALPGMPPGFGSANARPADDQEDSSTTSSSTSSTGTTNAPTYQPAYVPPPRPMTIPDLTNISHQIVYNNGLGPCTNDSEIFTSAIYLTHLLNGTVNTTNSTMDDLSPPQMAESASKLDVSNEEILLVGEIMVETYNELARLNCDPYFCRLFAAVADNTSKRFFFTPDSETFQDEPSVYVRMRYDVIGFCENIDELRLQGAFVFHKAMTEQLGCFFTDFSAAFQQDEIVNGTLAPTVDEKEDNIELLPELEVFRNATYNLTNSTNGTILLEFGTFGAGIDVSRRNNGRELIPRKTDGRPEAHQAHRERMWPLFVKHQERRRLQVSAEGRDIDGLDTMCPCRTEFPERRVATEVEFLDAFNDDYLANATRKYYDAPLYNGSALWTHGILDVTANSSFLHGAVDVVENNTLYTCDPNITQLDTLVIMDVDGRPEHMTYVAFAFLWMSIYALYCKIFL